MGNREVIYAGVDWDGSSLDRGAAAAKARFAEMSQAQQLMARNMGQLTGSTVSFEPAAQRAGNAAAASGEKLARYGLLASKASGSLAQLGVSSDVVSAGVQVATEVLAGMASTALLVAGGVGVLIAGVSTLVRWQTDLKKATEEATAEMVKQANLRGTPISSPVGVAATRIQLANLVAERDRLMADPTGGASPAGAWAGMAHAVGIQLPANSLLNEVIGKGAAAETRIASLTEQINKMRQALYPVAMTFPEIVVRGPGAYDVQATDAQISAAQLAEEQRQFDLEIERTRLSRLYQADFTPSDATVPRVPGWDRRSHFAGPHPFFSTVQMPDNPGWVAARAKDHTDVKEFEDEITQMTAYSERMFSSMFSNIEKGWTAMAKSMAQTFQGIVVEIVSKKAADWFVDAVFAGATAGAGARSKSMPYGQSQAAVANYARRARRG